MEEIIIELGNSLGNYVFKREVGRRSGISSQIDHYAENIFGQEILAVVKKHANIVSGAAVASAVPGGQVAAVAAIVASTWKMYYDINKKIGVSFSENFLKSVASGVASNLASNGVAAVGINLLSFIPGLGSIMAVGGTIAINRIAIHTAAVAYLKILNAVIDKGGELNESAIQSSLSSTAHTTSQSVNSVSHSSIESRCASFTGSNEDWSNAYRKAINLLYDLECCDIDERMRSLRIIEDIVV